jgi:predicted nucleic acid-binding protein
MSLYIVDASVALKWFLPESESEVALRLRAPSHLLAAPDYLWLEVGSVVCQAIQRKELTSEEGLEILPRLRKIPIQIFPSANLLDSAIATALETSTSFYDCLYLALAVSLNAQMVTADRRFCRALAAGQFANRLLWIGDIP